MGGVVWLPSCGSNELLNLLTNENCTGEEKQFQGRDLLQRRGRTEAVTDWEEKVLGGRSWQKSKPVRNVASQNA